MPANSAIIATPADWGADCAALCEARGVQARLTTDGLEATIAAVEDVPDVLVCDTDIGGVDCLSLCQRLKQHERLTHLEVFILGNGATAEVPAACEQLGVHCADTIDELLNKLGSFLPDGSVAATSASAEKDASEPISQPHDERPRILIIDDDRDLLRGLVVRLRPYEVDVATETSGRDALWTALEIKPNVIITDYRMPQGNGEYLLLRLKEEPSMRDVPVIVLTGWMIDGQRDQAHERDMLGRCGASTYLRKPVDFSTLVAELERYVPMRRKRR